MKSSSLPLRVVVSRIKASTLRGRVQIDRSSVWDALSHMTIEKIAIPPTLTRGERLPERAYVVAEDITARLTEWAKSRGFCMPQRAIACFLTSVEKILASSFGPQRIPVVRLSEERLVRATQKDIVSMVEKVGPQVGVVSLDPLVSVALRTTPVPQATLSLTRLTNLRGESINALGERPNSPPLVRQLALLKATFKSRNIKKVIIADDVMFSGSQMAAMITLLNNEGFEVVGLYATIATDDALSKISDLQKLCEQPISATASFSGSVTDIIDARDFLPGAPDGGRTVVGKSNAGMPYLLPFGQPVRWASLKESDALEVSKRLLLAALDLYRTIETTSQKPLRLSDLPRGVYTPALQENTATSPARVVEWLEAVLQRLIDHSAR